MNLYNDEQHPLDKELEGLRKAIDVRGGEKQKLRAYFHAFPLQPHHFREPSSALDAVAKVRLFQRLVKAREGELWYS
ncbi:hypothetical protein BJ165DRAFT_645323 [Panaeolus papilionaceus]|nr:hypothetical protein BJ165DRAFT_645323 [Panaeolus papilionaceus]